MDEAYFFTTRDLAERLAVSVSTIKNWSSRFPIEKHFDSQGNRRYSDKELSLSRDLDNLGDPVPSLSHAMDFTPLINEVTEAIQEQNDFAMKLSEASRTIGQLEATLTLREQQVEDMKIQIRELKEQIRLLITADRPAEQPAAGTANGNLGPLSWLVRRSS